MNKYSLTLLLIILQFALMSSSCVKKVDQENNESPNFLFILVDDLGKEWISAYGADSVTTPYIDELAAAGLTFQNAYSMPQCTPSRVTLLTGMYPYSHGWINHYDVPRWGHGARFDPEKNTTFANILKENGYKTCAAGKWQINDFRLEPDAMIRAGFEEFCMWTGGEGGNLEKSSSRYWDPYIHTKKGSRVYKNRFGPDIFTEFIIDFMSRHKDDPMFIYYPMVLTHGPLVTTPHEPDVKSNFEKHRAMTRYTDYLVERLVNKLDELEIRKKTYVIFTTDNGTAGNIIGYRNGTPVRGGKTYLTENGVNAPFIINYPGISDKGSVTDVLIDFTDLFPTFLELANVAVPENLKIEGSSFASVLRSASDSVHQRDWVLAMGSYAAGIGEDGRVRNWYDFRDRMLRNDRYKVYIDTMRRIYRLFDLKADPGEKQNLIDATQGNYIEVLKDFQKILDKIPAEDAHPDYIPLDTSVYDVPPEELLKMHARDLSRSNMSPPIE